MNVSVHREADTHTHTYTAHRPLDVLIDAVSQRMAHETPGVLLRRSLGSDVMLIL